MKTVQQGDIWKLGEHIIGCGDALDAAFVAKVVGDRKVRAIICDPPYAVAYVEGKRDFNKLSTDTDKVKIAAADVKLIEIAAKRAAKSRRSVT